MWSQTVQAHTEAQNNNHLSSNGEHMKLPITYMVRLSICGNNIQEIQIG